MVDTTIYRWAEGELVAEEWCDTNPGSVRVADSFLLVDGAVVALERHISRFTDGLRAQGIDLDSPAFIESALDVLPREGRWFPRIEAIDYGEGSLLRVFVRPAPEPLNTVTIATADHDPRTSPSIKGPDLATLGNLRRECGAGEAVILSEGVIAEGAWSSIVWWLDDRLYRVDSDIPRLRGVTESVVNDHASYIGATITGARVRPQDLVGAEVWVLSSLHGIRVATEWVGGPALHIEPGRAEYWQQQYTNRRVQV